MHHLSAKMSHLVNFRKSSYRFMILIKSSNPGWNSTHGFHKISRKQSRRMWSSDMKSQWVTWSTLSKKKVPSTEFSASHRVESSSDISFESLKKLTLSHLQFLVQLMVDKFSRCLNSWFQLQVLYFQKWGSDIRTRSMRKDWHLSLTSLPFTYKAQEINSSKMWLSTNCSQRKPMPRLLNSMKDINSQE